MRSIAPALLFAWVMGCGPATPSPTPTPKPNPTPADAGLDPTIAQLCTPLDLHRVALPGNPVQLTVSNQFTAIAFGAPTQGAAVAGPGCPDLGQMVKLNDCLTNRQCFTMPSAVDLAGLRKLAVTSGWQVMTLAGHRMEVLNSASGALAVVGSQLSASQALNDLLGSQPPPATSRAAAPAPGVVSALPCGANGAPCRPPDEPDCENTGRPPVRDALTHLGEGPTPECRDCAALCNASNRPADCACAGPLLCNCRS